MTIYQNKKSTFILLAFLVFFIFMNYSITRSAVDSLFLDRESSDRLPYAWVIAGFIMMFITSFYNKINSRVPILKLLGFTSIISAIFLSIILLGIQYNVKKSIFILYIWKETHIVLIVEIFWSFANSIFSTKQAKKTYGLLMLIGSIGGILGSLTVSIIVKQIGTIYTLWLTIFFFFISFCITIIFNRMLNNLILYKQTSKTSNLLQSFNTVIKSHYLVPLLFIVMTAQISITLIDYHYNTFIQNAYHNIDLRTSVMGKIHAILDCSSIFLQLFTSSFLKYLGLSFTLKFIPLLAGSFIFLFLLIPHLFFIVILRIGSKCLDYSLFKATKELLYIPLDSLVKTQGKAIIDILAYRLGKTFSSLLLLFFISINAIHYTLPLVLFLQFIWLIFTFIISKRYKEYTSKHIP